MVAFKAMSMVFFMSVTPTMVSRRVGEVKGKAKSLVPRGIKHHHYMCSLQSPKEALCSIENKEAMVESL